MTRSKLLMLAGASLLAVTPATAQAQRERNELGYFLPRVRVGAVVSELITRCPAAGSPAPSIATTIVIAGKARADAARFIHVDARSGILSARTTKLGLRPDGTLSSFNATTEGQGGEVLSAVIGLATTVASFGFGVPVPPVAATVASTELPLHCNPQTQARVARMNQLERELDNLRSSIAANGPSGATAQILAERTAELAEVVGELTLETSERFDPDRIDFRPETGPAQSQQARGLSPVAYHQWFTERGDALQRGLNATRVRGRFGYLATLTPDPAMLGALAGDGRGFPVAGASTPYLFYRRPVPAAVVVSACAGPLNNGACTAESGDGAITKRETVAIPQLSGPYSIPIGRGGLFGTRSAAATFDEQGAPLTLEYGSTSGGAAIAGVINAAGTAVTTLRDAETANITRRVALEEARDKLAGLLDEPAPAAAGGQ